MGITRELKAINKDDINHAYAEIDWIRRKNKGLYYERDKQQASDILGVVQDILIFIRDTFWSNQGVFQKPSVFNVIKWIRIVVFLVRQIRAIINITKR